MPLPRAFHPKLFLVPLFFLSLFCFNSTLDWLEFRVWSIYILLAIILYQFSLSSLIFWFPVHLFLGLSDSFCSPAAYPNTPLFHSEPSTVAGLFGGRCRPSRLSLSLSVLQLSSLFFPFAAALLLSWQEIVYQISQFGNLAYSCLQLSLLVFGYTLF